MNTSFSGYSLTVNLSPRWEVDTDTREAYSVDVFNPGFVLSMRCIPLDDDDDDDDDDDK